jgi:hypothetical protein
MREITTPGQVTIEKGKDSNLPKKTLDSYLETFFIENKIISNSEIKVRASENEVIFYPKEDNALVITKHRDEESKDLWERRYKPGIAIRRKIGKVNYLVYMINPSKEETEGRINMAIAERLKY